MATSNHEPWETALMLTGYFLFLFISGYLFWRTGPSYKMRKKKKELGYEVSDPFGSCMDCLWGPMRRSRWERENKFFRNTEYGEPDPDWDATARQRPWMKLRRGDEAQRRHMRAQAVAKAKTVILNEVADEILHWAVQTYIEDLKQANHSMEHALRQQAVASNPRQTAQRAQDFDNKQQTEDITQLLAEEEAEASLSESEPEDYMFDNDYDEADDDGVVLNTHVLEGRPAPLPRPASQIMHASDIAALPARFSNPQSFGSEFSSIPSVGDPVPNELLPLSRAGAETYISTSLVTMEPMWGQPGSHFIHANHVARPDGLGYPFIVTQLPLTGNEPGKKSTVDQFWRMVWLDGCAGCVLLADRAELKSRFWPGKAEQFITCGEVTVSFVGEQEADGGNVVINLRLDWQGQHRPFELCLHPHWPSAGVPSDAEGVVALMKIMSQKFPADRAPIVLMDSGAGTGAVGVLLALEYCIYQYNEGVGVDLLRTVAELREMRAGLVQTAEQYEFVHKGIYLHSLSQHQPPPAYQRTPKYQEGHVEFAAPAGLGRKESIVQPLGYEQAVRTFSSKDLVDGHLPAFAEESFMEGWDGHLGHMQQNRQ